jgi:hypothetical protein
MIVVNTVPKVHSSVAEGWTLFWRVNGVRTMWGAFASTVVKKAATG